MILTETTAINARQNKFTHDTIVQQYRVTTHIQATTENVRRPHCVAKKVYHPTFYEFFNNSCLISVIFVTFIIE